MFKKILFGATILLSSICDAQSIGIGTTTPASSAQLEVSSNSKGFLPPRLNNLQRNAIGLPVAGLIIWNSDCGEIQVYNGTSWTNMIGGVACLNFLPTVTTNSPTNVSYTTAVSGGTVSSDGGFSITARGVVWDTLHNPTILLPTKTSDGVGIGNFTSNLTNLLSNKTYYLRAYATNSSGTIYGNEFSFITLQPIAIVFDTVKICNQVWSVQNLNVTTYSNGDPIPQVTNSSSWQSLNSGAWCWYNNDSVTYGVYGKLYNWYAVTDPRGLAPAGWHVPSDHEWNVLTKCLDNTADTTCSCASSTIAGGMMKEVGYSHWQFPNTAATNSSGYTALPGGLRSNSGTFFYGGTSSVWWTTTASTASYAWNRSIYYADGALTRGYDNYFGSGFSVRVVKD